MPDRYVYTSFQKCVKDIVHEGAFRLPVSYTIQHIRQTLHNDKAQHIRQILHNDKAQHIRQILHNDKALYTN